LRLTLVAVCLAWAASAHAADGGVYVYLQPLGHEAGRLSFALSGVAAVAADGTEHALQAGLSAVDRASASRQRLLASGRIPPGSYAGLRLAIGRAALVGGQGGAALSVPGSPVLVDAPFVASAGRGSVLWLTLQYQASLTSGFAFAPVFSAVVPSRPITDHVGLVTDTTANTITVFDKALARVASVIETCTGPSGLALDRQRRRAYVTCTREDEVQSIDLATAEVLERTKVLPGDAPGELALTPDGRTLLVVNAGSASVQFFEAGSLARDERVPVGNGPASVIVEPGGRRAFVFNTLSNTVSVLDVASRSVAATISADASPVRGAFSGRGDRLYVIHEKSPFMTVLDPRQLSLITRARVTSGVGAIAVDTVRNLVCLARTGESGIELYDPNALVPVTTLPTRAGASYLAFDVEDNALYIVSPSTHSIVVGNLADRKVTAEIDVGDAPHRVAVMGER
jgi:YVTN family beta-propeller protein